MNNWQSETITTLKTGLRHHLAEAHKIERMLAGLGADVTPKKRRKRRTREEMVAAKAAPAGSNGTKAPAQRKGRVDKPKSPAREPGSFKDDPPAAG